MSALSKQDLEAKLGNASSFVITNENRHLVTQWAVASGKDPLDVHNRTNVELANMYHAEAGQATDEGKLAADMFCKITSALMPLIGVPVDPDALRAMVAEEVKTALADLPNRKLDVTSPRGTVTLEAAMHALTPKVIKVAALGDNIMLVGPAGCGKTTIGTHVAKALQLPFYVTSTINDPHELLGFVNGHGKYHDTPFRNAFENGGVWIADEIDAWDAGALLAANAALANGFANFPDSHLPVHMHVDFRMIATANTFGNGADRVYVGRNELDAASLDRFATINVDYDATLEAMFAQGNDSWLRRVLDIRAAVVAKKIRHVVSSRAILKGARALAAGIDRDDVEEFYVFKGMSPSDRDKIK